MARRVPGSGNFTVELDRLIQKAKIAPDIALRKICIDLFADIVKRTPVDTGALRANWQASIGRPAEGIVKGEDKSGSGAISKANAVLSQAKVGTPIWFTNNLPYAGVVEYGGYPQPVKRGTYVPKGKYKYGVRGPAWVKRTIRGYSRQAPRGIVRVAIQEYLSRLRSAFK